MLTVIFYTRPACTLCDSALAVVRRVQKRLPFQLDIVDIDTSPGLRALYGASIPVVVSEKTELARSFVDEKNLHRALRRLAAFR